MRERKRERERERERGEGRERETDRSKCLLNRADGRDNSYGGFVRKRKRKQSTKTRGCKKSMFKQRQKQQWKRERETVETLALLVVDTDDGKASHACDREIRRVLLPNHREVTRMQTMHWPTCRRWLMFARTMADDRANDG